MKFTGKQTVLKEIFLLKQQEIYRRAPELCPCSQCMPPL